MQDAVSTVRDERDPLSSPRFRLSPEHIEARLRAKPTLGEFAALVLAAGLLLGFAVLSIGRPALGGLDYRVFLDAAQGNPAGYYYADWFLPVFDLLGVLPFSAGYVLWGLLNLAGVWFALRVFNGPRVLVLVSYQVFYVVYYGNIAGVIVGGLALAWWSLHRDRYLLAGIGFFIAATKFQLGVPLGLAVWLLADTSWYTRFRALLVALLGLLASLLIWPDWPLDLYYRLISAPPYAMGNISLWSILGPVVLLLLLPPLVLPLTRERRLIAWTAAVGLAMPYFQQTDLLGLFVLPVGWLPLAGNIGYGMFRYGWQALQWMSAIPVIAYVWVLLGTGYDWLSRRQ